MIPASKVSQAMTSERLSQVATVVKDVIETLMLWNGQASAGLDVKGLAGLRDELNGLLAAPPSQAQADADEIRAIRMAADLMSGMGYHAEASEICCFLARAGRNAPSQAQAAEALTGEAIEQIIAAAMDCIRHDVGPDWQRSALRNRLRAMRAATQADEIQATTVPEGWMLVPKHRGTVPLKDLIIAASLACIENRLMDADDRHELAQYADQLQHTPASPVASEREGLTDEQVRRIAEAHFWGGKCTTVDDIEKAIKAAILVTRTGSDK